MPFEYDSAVLKTFIALAETGSFSQAGHIVGRTQSAVSLQIKKLEQSLGVMLVERKVRQARLTEEGRIFLAYARHAIEMQWQVYNRLRLPEVKGGIRLGVPEDFATHVLPGVLSDFKKHYPAIDLDIECDLTLNLLDGFKKKKYDIVLLKRDMEKVKGGTKVWREPLVWAAANSFQVSEVIPLVVSPQPCVYRARALSALDRVKRKWKIVYTSPSLSGTVAAVNAGLGVSVLPQTMVAEGLRVLGKAEKMPNLSAAEIALMKRERISEAGKVFSHYIMQYLEKLHPDKK